MITELRIRELAAEKGLTQKDLAEKCGVSAVSLSRINNGIFKPSLDTLEKIAAALGVEVSALFAAPAECVITCPHCGKTIQIKAEGK